MNRRRGFDKIIQIHRRHGFGEIIQKTRNTVGDMVSAKIQIVAAVKKYINKLTCSEEGSDAAKQIVNDQN